MHFLLFFLNLFTIFSYIFLISFNLFMIFFILSPDPSVREIVLAIKDSYSSSVVCYISIILMIISGQGFFFRKRLAKFIDSENPDKAEEVLHILFMISATLALFILASIFEII